jgi:hypothetical protein
VLNSTARAQVHSQHEYKQHKQTQGQKIQIRNKKFWEELIAYFPLIRHTPYRKRCLQQFIAAGMFLLFLLSNDRGIRRQTHRHTRPTILLLLRVFIDEGTCFPSRCLAMKVGIHIQTHRLIGGIYEVRRWDVLRCHNIHTKVHWTGSGNQKLIGGGGGLQTDSMEIARVYINFFKIR